MGNSSNGNHCISVEEVATIPILQNGGFFNFFVAILMEEAVWVKNLRVVLVVVSLLGNMCCGEIFWRRCFGCWNFLLEVHWVESCCLCDSGICGGSSDGCVTTMLSIVMDSPFI